MLRTFRLIFSFHFAEVAVKAKLNYKIRRLKHHYLVFMADYNPVTWLSHIGSGERK